MTYEDEVLADAPLLYWRLSELSGTVANDASGNGRDGTAVSSPGHGYSSLLATDPTNFSYFFDGISGSYVNYADATALTDFSIECWVKTTATQDGFLIHRWPDNSSWRTFILILSSTGNPYFEVVNNASSSTFTTPGVSLGLNDDVPHHIVATYGGGTLTLYADGVQVGTPASLGGTLRNIAPFQVGSRDTFPVSFEGQIDEVAYYDTALSADRVLAHYLAGSELTPPEITTTSPLPDGTVGVFYSVDFEVTGAAGAWSVGAGLPPGIDSFSGSTGVLEGTPTTPGTYNFDVTYEEFDSELSDTEPFTLTISEPTPPPSGDVGGCDCAQDWRLELVDLATGQRRGWLPFISFTFDDLLDQVGAATVTVPVRKIKLPDVWPHLRAVVFTRTSGPDASESSPVCEYIGMIETVRAESGGTVQLGLQSIEHYLTYRTLTGDTSYTSTDQNEICVDLMALGSGSGIPLSGVAEASAFTRSRSWTAEDDAVILEKILEITQAVNGPDYRRVFTFASGAWSTVLRFADYVGNTVPQKLNAVRGLIAYGVTVEGAEHANWVRGRGQGIVYTDDTYMTDIYPRFNRAIQWSDVTLPDTLQENVEGYLAANADPIAVPDATVADLNISARFKVGDSIDLNMDHGAIRYKGVARLVGKSWSIDPESPSLCTFSFVPLENARSTILGAPPGNGTGCC